MDGRDRFSDLNLTFGTAGHVPVADVLDDWTRTLIAECDAVQLADLERDPTVYRVFLLPDALQFDLSMTPSAQFRAAGHGSGSARTRQVTRRRLSHGRRGISPSPLSGGDRT